MYMTLLLFAPAFCEWVEISQQHYRKPLRPHHFHNLDKLTEEYAEEITTEFFHQHNKNPPRTQSFPDIKFTENYDEDITSEPPQIRYRKPTRTQYFPADGVTEVYVEDTIRDTLIHDFRKPILHPAAESVTESFIQKTTSDITHSFIKPTRSQYRDTDKVINEEFNKRNRIYLNQSISETSFWNKGNINKVPKHGNVQRVQLEKNAIKAPSLRNPPKYSIDVVYSKDENKNFTKNTNINAVKQSIHDQTVTEETLHDKLQSENIYIERRISTLKSNNNRPNYKADDLGLKKYVHTIDIEKKDDKITTDRRKANATLGIISDLGLSQSIPNSPFMTEGEPFDNDATSAAPSRYTSSTNHHSKDSAKEKKTGDRNELPNKYHKNFNNKPSEFTNNVEKPVDEDYATVSDDSEEGEQMDSNDDESDYDNNKPSKANTMGNLMSFMKVVADTIRRNTRKTVNSKTKYLNDLKHTILCNIKERIDSTWPDDPPETQGMKHSRVSRAVQASARGHLEIPSSESALMTISFLTFAVFLIKLVLQVIQTYKNKAMMVTPAVVATVGRVAAASKRSAKP